MPEQSSETPRPKPPRERWCDHCDGTGVITTMGYGNYWQESSCGKCKGTGRVA